MHRLHENQIVCDLFLKLLKNFNGFTPLQCIPWQSSGQLFCQLEDYVVRRNYCSYGDRCFTAATFQLIWVKLTLT